MPVNVRPRDLIDLLTNVQGALTSPSEVALGTIVSPVILTRGGITTLGNAYAFPSVAKGTTWFAFGNGSGTVSTSDTSLFNETGRVPALPLFVQGNSVIAAALLSAAYGNGVVTEIGLYGPASPGHSNASQTRNSGTLYAHVLLDTPVVKHCLKSITVEWQQN